MKILVAFFAALNAATGAPADLTNMPDRPPILVPTLAPLPTLLVSPANDESGRQALSGSITNLQDGFVFVNGVPVLLGPATQVSGRLRVGLDVTIQATLRPDGVLEADELDFSETLVPQPATAQPAQLTHSNATDEPPATSTLIQASIPASPVFGTTEDIKPQAREKPEVRLTETPAAKPAEKTQVEPTENPTAKPSGKTQVEPTESPPVQPTAISSTDGGKTVQEGASQPSDTSRDSSSSQDSSKDDGEVQQKGD